MIFIKPIRNFGVVFICGFGLIFPAHLMAVQAPGKQEWDYSTNGVVASSSAYSAGMILIGSNDNSLYALNATTGVHIWNYTTGGAVESSPAVEAVALTTQAIAVWAGSNKTQETTKTVTESIAMVAEWALLAKSVWTLGKRIKSFVDYFCKSSRTKPLSSSTQLIASPVASDAGDTNMHLIDSSDRFKNDVSGVDSTQMYLSRLFGKSRAELQNVNGDQ